MIAGLTRIHLHSWVVPVRVHEDIHGQWFAIVPSLQVEDCPGEGVTAAWVDLAEVRCAADWCTAKPDRGEGQAE